MHILFLTDNFPPEVNAPASRTYEHCRQWVAAGHRVTVVTCAPNFPKGRVFPGYKNRIVSKESIDGIAVIRVWTYITANEGFARRILDYTSFMIAGAISSLFVRRVDVVVGTSPQFFTACAAWFVAALKRVPFVFELRDLWPESIKAVGAMEDSIAIRLLERVELFLYRRAALIVSVTHSFRRDLARRGIDADKIVVITNGADLSRFHPQPRNAMLANAIGVADRFVAGYVGTHGMAHALETLLHAAKALQTQAPDVQIVLLGDGARKPELQRLATEMNLTNVLFLDSVAKDRVADYWSLLDVSIIHLARSELFLSVIPSKLFECMAMGLPVVHAVAGESAEIVERERVGVIVMPQDAAGLAASIVRLRDDAELRRAFAMRGPQAARNYDRVVLAQTMLAALMRLFHGTKGDQ